MSSPCLCLAVPNATPFILTVQDSILLEQSQGFNILRQHLLENSCNEFCESHRSDSYDDLQAWVVMRDIMHALLAPIVALTNHATEIAKKYTKLERPSDVEFAFRSRGRNAFVWLQSFLAEDEEWCLSKACPGCVVQHALDAEFQLRLLVAACMLSREQGAEPTNGPTLPSFEFLLPSLRQTLAEDELWGPDYYEHVEQKAQDLTFGMKDLMRQCEKLEILMTPPTTPEPQSPFPSFSYFPDRRAFLKTTSKTVYPNVPTTAGMRVRRTKIAKVQAKMAKEEEAWLQSLLQAAWEVLNPVKFDLPSFPSIRRISIPNGP